MKYLVSRENKVVERILALLNKVFYSYPRLCVSEMNDRNNTRDERDKLGRCYYKVLGLPEKQHRVICTWMWICCNVYRNSRSSTKKNFKEVKIKVCMIQRKETGII